MLPLAAMQYLSGNDWKNLRTVRRVVRLKHAAGSGWRWPTAIDVFCGLGGLSLGLRRARFRVAAAIDILPLAVESYGMNFRRVPVIQGDVREPDTASKLLRVAGLREGELDLLAGCPPCQGFSAIRTRRRGAVEDDRNNLVLDFLRLVRELRPRLVLMENVPGLRGDDLFREFTQGITACGLLYDCKVLDSAEFGTPQQRRRLVFVAARDEEPSLVDTGGTERRTVRDTIGRLADSAGHSGDPLHDHGEQRAERIRAVITAIPKDGGSRADLPDDEQLECHRRGALHGYGWGRNIYARMAWDRLAPTITGGCINPSKGRFLHPEKDRAITIREALLLQGFPAEHQVSLRRGKYAAAEIVGNAIPPGFVEAQARMLWRVPIATSGIAG